MDTQAFRRILKLEEQKDYQNKSIIGGIDNALYRFLADMEQAITSPQKLASFSSFIKTFAPYTPLPPAERTLWIKSIYILLDELDKILADRTNMPIINATPKIRRAESKTVLSQDTAKPVAVITTMKKKTETHKSTEIVLQLPLTTIKGISETIGKKFNKLNIYNIYDMCTHYPSRHLDYGLLKKISQLQAGNEETIRAFVWETSIKKGDNGRQSSEAVLGDDSGNVRALWFNNPYIAKNFKSGDEIIVSGRVSILNHRAVFESPEWEYADKAGTHTGRLVPVYPLTAGLSQRQARKLFKEATETYHGAFKEFLPAEIRKRQGLIDLSKAILQAHYPDSWESKEQARKRLAFDELFILQVGALKHKYIWQKSGCADSISVDQNLLQRFVVSLPFSMTDAQKRVTQEILQDMQKTIPASRLIQGEVGSGKTVVAAICLLLAAQDGKQGALMAPTEILAEQHFRSLCKLYGPLAAKIEENQENPFEITLHGLTANPLRLALLSGEVKGKARQEIYKNIADGRTNILVGTHAVIQKDVEFTNLALAIIDEQHRFGVNQRQELRNKGQRPHTIAMTATPIPRTLSLTIYGDLDLSVIDQMPEGRQRTKTKWLNNEERNKAYAFIQKQINEGRQAFIICPLVEESETVAAKAATSEYEYLSKVVFPNFKVGLITGRLSSKEKEAAMHSFSLGQIDILVATAVVEVGIDVPNATVILVESAERFGLAQLHQFRGRVGRGGHQSYCLLLSENISQDSMNRLRIIESTQDGFALAEEDLKMRGPGEFFGTRQSGMPELKMAKLSDVMLLERARKEAQKLFEQDPELKNPELKEELNRVWREVEDKLS
ncbi:MAG: ATP-dependent DNA helicase RecG [Chloroflexi bacterium]|nr:ATP-dependent DNA helicase RecG [Chloroflexota bacterium]